MELLDLRSRTSEAARDVGCTGTRATPSVERGERHTPHQRPRHRNRPWNPSARSARTHPGSLCGRGRLRCLPGHVPRRRHHRRTSAHEPRMGARSTYHRPRPSDHADACSTKPSRTTALCSPTTRPARDTSPRLPADTPSSRRHSAATKSWRSNGTFRLVRMFGQLSGCVRRWPAFDITRKQRESEGALLKNGGDTGVGVGQHACHDRCKGS